jgi:hypothetical protein
MLCRVRIKTGVLDTGWSSDTAISAMAHDHFPMEQRKEQRRSAVLDKIPGGQ